MKVFNEIYTHIKKINFTSCSSEFSISFGMGISTLPRSLPLFEKCNSQTYLSSKLFKSIVRASFKGNYQKNIKFKDFDLIHKLLLLCLFEHFQ